MSEDEGFLQRWSRRKQDALREDGDSEPSEQPEEGQQVAAEESASEEQDEVTVEASEAADLEGEEPEPPGDEDMPPLESLDQGGSIKPFMSPRVSESLRRAALRRLFRQPKYNVVDMLDDYAEDYSKPVALGNIVTADMRYRAEQAAKRMARLYKESTSKSNGEDIAATEATDSETGTTEQVGSVDQSAAQKAQDPQHPGDDQLADSGETSARDEDTVQHSDPKPG